MPLVNVTLVEGIFSTEEKHAMVAKCTDVMVEFEGSEAFHEVVWVLIDERHIRRNAARAQVTTPARWY